MSACCTRDRECDQDRLAAQINAGHQGLPWHGPLKGGATIPPRFKRFSREPPTKHRVNKAIHARELRVIGDDGKQLGVMPTHIALRIAEEKGLDLVEVNPKTEPPVCKIIDYGRFKYEESKKKAASKRKQSVVQVKEVKLRPKTGIHDLDVKVRSILRFLSEGNKAKLVIVFRGREIVHPETGRAVLLKVLTELGEYAVVEQMPVMEGRRMMMLVAPKPGVKIPSPKKDEAEETEETEEEEEEAQGAEEVSQPQADQPQAQT